MPTTRSGRTISTSKRPLTFCEYLSHSSMSPAQVRGVLDEIEIANAKIHGYGSHNFARNLTACFEHLAERDISPRRSRSYRQFAFAILEQADGTDGRRGGDRCGSWPRGTI